MSLDRVQKKAAKQMIKMVSEAVYQDVGRRLVEESKSQQKSINKQLIDRLDQWDKDVKERVRAVMDEELVPMISKIVKLEVFKNK
jgi:hypothetical protein